MRYGEWQVSIHSSVQSVQLRFFSTYYSSGQRELFLLFNFKCVKQELQAKYGRLVLFKIHVPSLRQMIVIANSQTPRKTLMPKASQAMAYSHVGLPFSLCLSFSKLFSSGEVIDYFLIRLEGWAMWYFLNRFWDGLNWKRTYGYNPISSLWSP